jgi:hypothetical protein
MGPRGFIPIIAFYASLRSKRDAGLKMRNGRGDQLENPERLEQLNEDDEQALSQLCGTYVG